MTFDDFWAYYPKKVAKQDALKAWGQLTMFDQDEIDMVYELHVRTWRGKDPQFIPHPATWLRGRRWEDDLSAAVQRDNHEFFRINGYHRATLGRES
jgi:hypothetical protein